MAILIIAVTLAAILLVSICLILLRLRAILDPGRSKQRRRRGKGRTHLLIVLGSGGHSAEMIAMLERAVREEDARRKLEWEDYSCRTWIVGSGDDISARRAKEFEEMVAGLQKVNGNANGKVRKAEDTKWRIVTVPRAREIHQPMLTAPVSCLRCLVACWNILLPTEGPRDIDRPDLIICNGPATATILVLTSVLLRFFNVRGCNSEGKMRTVYIESWARVKRLSLSGWLMVRVVDRFFVQWQQLLESTGGRGEYLGVLV